MILESTHKEMWVLEVRISPHIRRKVHLHCTKLSSDLPKPCVLHQAELVLPLKVCFNSEMSFKVSLAE